VWQILLLGGLSVLFTRTDRVGAVLKKNWPVVLFLAYCLTSITWSDYPFISLKRWTKAAGDLTMVLILLTDLNPMAAVKRTLTRVGLWFFAISVLFIQFYPEMGRVGDSYLYEASYIGITNNKNELGMISMVWNLAFLAFLLDAFEHRNERLRGGWPAVFAYGVAVVTGYWLLVRCDSATSLTCFLLGAFMLVMTSLKFFATKPVLVHLLAVGLISLAIFAIFIAPTMLSAVGRNSSLTGRTDVWVLVRGMVSNPLLGTGFEGFWLGWRLDRMWQIYWWHPNEAHNGYIETYINLGWMGLGFLSFMILKGYGKAVSSLRERLPLSNLPVAYITIALIYNITESAFRAVNPVWFMVLFASTTIPLAFRAKTPQQAAEAQAVAVPRYQWFDPGRTTVQPGL
jgi:hypothetical protein